ncbi:integrase-like protein [Arthrobacter sp. AG258]|uniref:DDE-type integrase/transposase/recombinase n=1 Tax=Arthrobacter sp. AG258 TaxID=2183899 RepID=UPI0010600887|nr:DDE-type integrase/transposase/recombinase [Arthrobacter sp. AG258]TDT82520.1 integrase-like protein [Arthrobacter sp. AG258]
MDDHSRYLYCEILPGETKENASAFMRNAIAASAAQGVKIQRVLTANVSCYRSRALAAVLADAGIEAVAFAVRGSSQSATSKFGYWV